MNTNTLTTDADHYRELSVICKQNGVGMVTATQPIRPGARPPRNSKAHLALMKARNQLAPCHFHDFEVPLFGIGG